MCNAWNHSPECTCGWGGDGHLGRRVVGNASSHNPWLSYLRFTGYSSYTNPNASCPVCGEPVFFYQSPSGGRVFFEELGPPWPKHPCTDNPHAKFPTPTYRFQPEASKTYTWQKAGWVPFVVKALIPQPPQFKLFNIRGEVNGEELSIYTAVKGLNEKAPFLVKKLDESHYEISTVQFPQFSAIAREFKFFGYTHAMDAAKQPAQLVTKAHASSRSVRSAVVSARPTRPTQAPASRSNASKLPKQEEVKRREPKPMNALQLALLASGLKK